MRHLIPMPMAVPNCDTVVVRMVHTIVDIVGTDTSNRGRSCIHHKTCGTQVKIGTKVMFCWVKVVYRDQGREEDAIMVSLVANGTMTCKVVFFPAHLVTRTQDYNGLIARMISINSDCCTNMLEN